MLPRPNVETWRELLTFISGQLKPKLTFSVHPTDLMKTDIPSPLALQYERDGFVTVPNLLGPAECDKLKIEARRVLDEHADPGSSVYLHVAVHSPIFKRLSEDPRLIDILRQILPKGVMFLSDKIVYKAAEQTSPTPWHVDYFYWLQTRPKLSIWIPLDDVTAENGTLTVIPGSHKKTWPMEKNESGYFSARIRDADWNADDIVSCDLKCGGAIFFSDRLVHGSTTNSAGSDRYVIISTYHAPAADEPFDLKFPARKVLIAS
jgi:hypothetical protein